MEKITMKKFVTLALLMVLSLTACGGNTEPAENEAPADVTTSDSAEPAESETSESPSEAVTCTPEAYAEAIAALTVTTGAPTRTYEDVVALFGGVEDTPNTDMEYEGYSYYNWTDGTKTALLTFTVEGDNKTYFAITGDIN